MTNVTKMTVAALLGAVVAGCSIPPRSEWPQTVKLRNDSIMAAKLMPAGVADMVAADGEEATIAVAKKRVGELLKDPDIRNAINAGLVAACASAPRSAYR